MFAGKTVIITGSSSGIGADAALEFAKEGANVILHGRNQEALSRVKIQCLSTGKVTESHVASVVGDICSDQVQNDLIETAIQKFGKIDVLVNNAGLLKPTPVSKAFDMIAFNDMFDVNVKAVVSLTMKCIDHLKASKGTVVNISSIASTRALKGIMGYCMSKSALDAFTRTLAAELAPFAIRVNAVSPGPIPTDITRLCDPFLFMTIPGSEVFFIRYPFLNIVLQPAVLTANTHEKQGEKTGKKGARELRRKITNNLPEWSGLTTHKILWTPVD